jgi:hypothetical protein
MKTSKKTARPLVILLCCLMIGLMPISALAAPSDFTCVLIGSKNITDQEAAELTGANGGKIVWDSNTATLTLENANLKDFSNWGATYGIIFEAPETATPKTVTVILKGTNYIGDDAQTALGSAFCAINCNLVIKAENGGTLNIKCKEDTYGANAIYATNAVSIEGAALNLEADYPAIYTDSTLDIKDSQVVAESTADSAIFTRGKTTITGKKTKVTAKGVWCALIAKTEPIDDEAIPAADGVEISEAEFIGHTQSDHIIYTNNGGIAIDNAKVTLTSDYENATGLFVDNADGSLTISDSIVDIKTDSTSVFSQKDISITNSELNLTSGGNGINAWGNLTISGDKTNIVSKSSLPIVGGTVEIKGGSVKSETTEGSAICSDENGGIIISGGNVYAKTTAAMAAIYAKKGDIKIDGTEISVEAISTMDSAIFARDGKIILNAAPIKAASAEGFAAIVARNSYEEDTESAMTPSIEIGELYTAGDYTVVTTMWKTDDNGQYYADAVFAPTGTQGPLEDTSALPNGITLKLKTADYTKVEEAIAKANALTKGDYKDFSAVDTAIAAVVRGKDITEQTVVDDYAVAIENAIAALTYKSADYGKVEEAIAKIPTDLSLYTDATVKALNDAKNAVVRGKNITEQETVDAMAKAINDAVSALEAKPTPEPDDSDSPQTGDNSNIWLWLGLMLLSCGGVIGTTVYSKKRKAAR